ncbi:MAG TPA: hypothetical protein VJ995_07950 [Geothermobacteraceae bacterium]|nr:hypothetical protein [Geothermobacteraceae bacterium]
MVVGFNHNFRYKNEVFHVQTEDGGLKFPNIITLLYRGGTILASKKTSYADITKTANLDQVVEELMKEQHKEMLRRLKDGEFDDVIEARRPGAMASSGESVTSPAVPAPQPVAPAPEPVEAVPTVAEKPIPAPAEKPAEEPAVELGLDDIILSYLVGDD